MSLEETFGMGRSAQWISGSTKNLIKTGQIAGPCPRMPNLNSFAVKASMIQKYLKRTSIADVPTVGHE
jgi:hypothetical protein